MPRISLSFSGWVSGANIDTAMVVDTCEDISVAHMSAEDLVKRIEKGELVISLSEAMDNCKKSECELTDYEETD